MKTAIFLFMITCYLTACNSTTGNNETNKVNTDTTVSYKDQLIDSTFPLVDTLLIKYGEFFPVAAAVQHDGSLASVATYDGDERPLSDTVIAQLKRALKLGFEKGEYKAGVIFYDVYAARSGTDVKSDAVAFIYESAAEDSALHYYYPYTLTKKRELTYLRGWYNVVPKEIFVK